MQKLNVAFVGCYQTNLNVGFALRELKKSVEALEKLSRERNFSFYPIREGVFDKDSAIKVVRELKNKEIDFVLIQSSSLAPGEIIPVLADISPRLGLWAIPEPTEEGPIPLISFCGMNMYGSIIGNYLKDHSINLKWFFGDVDSELFLNRFNLTIDVLAALKSLSCSRLGLIGGIAPGFYDLYFDERKLRSRYGVSVSRNEFSEILQKAISYPESEITKLADQIKKEGLNKGVESQQFEKAARIYLALEEIARENDYSGLAISCWPKFQQEYGFSVCSTIGRLNQNGIAASCEGDIPGVLSMLLLNYLNQDCSTLMDLVKLDTQDNSLLMWHCGPTAECWADEKGVSYCPHYVDKVGIINDLTFKAQSVTIMRVTDDGSRIFLARGNILKEKKKNFDGSRGWIGNLRILEKKASTLDFVNTIMVNRFEHHYPIASGNLYEQLMEACAWLSLEPIEIVAYQNYLQNPS